jgi:hypothetical protein
MTDDRGRQLLDQAFDALERNSPKRLTRVVHWVRSPASRWVRLPLGILCILASFLWFLPVLGIWLLPIGLLLVAQDVPFLRRPVARMMLWLEDRWLEHRARRKRNR